VTTSWKRKLSTAHLLLALTLVTLTACFVDPAPTATPPPLEPTPTATTLAVEPTVRPTTAPPIPTDEPPTPSIIVPTGAPSTPTPHPTLTSTPVPSVVLRTAELGGWTTPLDPHNNTSPAFHRFFGNVYSGLVRWQTDENLGSHVRIVVPDLAESWTQPNALTYEFTLREGVRWHNIEPAFGRSVTADDVTFSIRRLFGSSHQSLWRRVGSISTVNETTVRVTLTSPYPGFLAQLASGFNAIVLPELADGLGLEEGPPVGTGPFVFDARGSHFLTRGIISRHEGFYEPERPQVDRIERIIVGDQRAAIAMLRTGSIDYLFTDVGGIEEALDADRGDFDSFRYTNGTGWALTFKQTAPFDDPRARRAATLSIDRTHFWVTYTRAALPIEVGLGIPLPDVDARLSAERKAPYFSYDPDGARALLESLGTAGREPFIVSIPDVGVNQVDAGLELVRDLRRAGFSAEANVMPVSLYATTVQAPPGNFDVSLGPVGAPPEADLWLHERFGPSGAFNTVGPVDPELDALIAAQRQAADPRKRAMLLQETQIHLLEAAYQPMVFLDQTWLVTTNGWTGWPRSFPDEPFQRFLREVSPAS
jgi:peptide/nickel transport system substrate-binding protein